MKQQPRPERYGRDVTYLSPTREWIVRGLAVFSLAYGLYWLGWRWTETLNPNALAFSIVLVLAETWGWIGSAFFLFHAWKLSYRRPPPAPPGKTVDVFITTYDEPLEVLRRTAMGARAIRYPHRTYILDDGKREEVKQLAQDMGLGYIRRVGNAQAKAGNLNYAISVTNGEFILQLDTDHVPMPDIIHKLLGYFNDPQVAFIQSPQDFYNTDSFTHVVNEDSRSEWEENRIFYSLLQRGKDVWNASFFCGSCGMLRRTALEQIGGFSTKTIIEDMETSLALHVRGWKSVYHPEPLAFGLSPGSAASFHVQRLRWAQGSMQMLRKYNPLTIPGLTPAQRACYFSANIYPIDGLQKAIFYVTPVIFLLTGAAPVAAEMNELLKRLIPYLIISIGSFELLSRGTGWLFIQERYNMAKCFTYILALTGLIAKNLKFNVTPKGATAVAFKLYAPQLVLLIASAAALIWAPLAYSNGWVDYNVESMGLAYLMSGVWAGWNIWFAASVIRLSLGAKQQRSDHRFRDTLLVNVRLVDAPADAPHEQLVLTRDLNPQGLGFRSTQRIEPGTKVEVSLPLSTTGVLARGEVIHTFDVETAHGQVVVHGVRFEGLSIDERDAIELHCTQHSVPIWRMRYRQSLDFIARATEVVRNSRGGIRRLIQLPAQVCVFDADGIPLAEYPGLLEELSTGGAKLLLEHALPDGSEVQYRVPGTSISGRGAVIFSHPLESPLSVRFAVGVRTSRRMFGLAEESELAAEETVVQESLL